MHKFLKLSAVSMLAVIAASNANAAGYTCEELIEYTSCSPGYYLSHLDGTCPEGYEYHFDTCIMDGDTITSADTELECEDEEGTFWYAGAKCMAYNEESLYEVTNVITAGQTTCAECPAGSTCAGDTADKVACAAGTYQPNTKQTECLTTPAGNFSTAGAANYTACSAGQYQPESGQASCLSCPAGSECATTGLVSHTLCEIGEYSFIGATACSSCPETKLIDKDGKTVTATTVSKGSSSIMACYIGSEWYFTDTKGTYHFTPKCNAFDTATATYGEKVTRCESLGGSIDSYTVDDEGGNSVQIYYCKTSISEVDPDTPEAECSAYPYCYYEDGHCQCQYDCDYEWAINMETGSVYCEYGY